MADANLTQIGYVAEDTFLTTPASALQILRTTGGQITPTQNSIVSDEIRADLRAGNPVRTSQLAEGALDHEWSFTTLDDMLEGMFMESWSSDVLVDGTTKKAFTFEDQFTGLDTPLYNAFQGCRIMSMSMDISMDSIIGGSIGVMSAKPDVGRTSSVGTGDPTAATTTGPWNSVDMVDSLTEGASGSTAASLAKVTSVQLQFDRELRQQREIGNLNAWGIGTGRLIVTGSITQYFEDVTLITPWKDFTDRALNITIEDEDGNSFLIEVPKYKLVGDLQIDNPGVDTDRMVTANIEAYATATDAALARFTRTAA